MNAERGGFGVFAGFVDEAEPGRDGEVDLVGGDGELAADRAPDLDIDLRSVEGGFVRHFDVVDPAPLQDAAHHRLGLEPERTVIDELLTELGRIVGGKAHDVFLDPEDLEILQIHLIDGVELLFELLLGAVDVGVVHLERAHPHEPEEFADLLVAVVAAVLREAQREVAITVRHRGEELVVMRAVHRFEVIIVDGFREIVAELSPALKTLRVDCIGSNSSLRLSVPQQVRQSRPRCLTRQDL